jgi:hypothetical protein
MGFRTVARAGIAFLLLISVMARAPAAELTKIRVGGVAPSGDLVEVMFAKPGIAKHAGKTYKYAPMQSA